MNPVRHLWILVLCVVIALAAYSNILNSYFLSDDFAQIGKVLHGDLSVSWGRAHGGFFRPLFILSYWIDGRIWGARPLGFHLTNVLLHALNAFSVSIVALQLVRDQQFPQQRKTLIALGAALLFLLHPSHTEAVSWISGRADLLATFFSLTALAAYIAHVRGGSPILLALSLGSFALALLSKESAICLPLLILAAGIVIGHARRDPRHFLKVFASFIILLVAFVLVRYYVLGSLVGGYGTGQHLNFSPAWIRDRIIQAQLRALLPALPYQWSGVLLKPLRSQAFLGFVVICLALLGVLIALRRRSYLGRERRTQNWFLLALIVFFLLSLLPAINLRLSLYDPQGERFIYLPSVFACLLLTYLLTIFFRRIGWWAIALITLSILCGFSLYRANNTWRQAGELARALKNDLAQTGAHEHVIVLNAPDNLRGVPVYHNGLPEAAQFFQSSRLIGQVEVVALHGLGSIDEVFELSPSVDTVRVETRTSGPVFTETHDTACVVLLDRTEQSFAVRLLPCAADADVFYFNRGRMLALPSR